MAHRRQANIDLSEAERMISQREVERYIKLTDNFIKQLKRIKSVKQRKAVATSAILDIIIKISSSTVEAVGLLEYAKQALVTLMDDEYRLKTRAARPSEAIV